MYYGILATVSYSKFRCNIIFWVDVVDLVVSLDAQLQDWYLKVFKYRAEQQQIGEINTLEPCWRTFILSSQDNGPDRMLLQS